MLLPLAKGLGLQPGMLGTGICSLNPGLTCLKENHPAQYLVPHSGKRIPCNSKLLRNRNKANLALGLPLA